MMKRKTHNELSSLAVVLKLADRILDRQAAFTEQMFKLFEASGRRKKNTRKNNRKAKARNTCNRTRSRNQRTPRKRQK